MILLSWVVLSTTSLVLRGVANVFEKAGEYGLRERVEREARSQLKKGERVVVVREKPKYQRIKKQD